MWVISVLPGTQYKTFTEPSCLVIVGEARSFIYVARFKVDEKVGSWSLFVSPCLCYFWLYNKGWLKSEPTDRKPLQTDRVTDKQTANTTDTQTDKHTKSKERNMYKELYFKRLVFVTTFTLQLFVIWVCYVHFPVHVLYMCIVEALLKFYFSLFSGARNVAHSCWSFVEECAGTKL